MISRRASVYGRLTVHETARVDDFAVLSGTIAIERYVHVACHCSIIGDVTLREFSGLSGGVRLYAKSDDYSGQWMTNPTVPERFTRVHAAPIDIGRHAIIGANAVIMPGVTIGEGAAVGAGAFITRDVEPWTIVVDRGRVIGHRDTRCEGLSCGL